MRRGFQDFEYLRLIEKSGKKSRAELRGNGRYHAAGSRAGYAKVRAELYELLAARASGGR